MSAETELLDLLQKVGAGTLAAPAETEGNENSPEVTTYVETSGTEEAASAKDGERSATVTVRNLFVHPLVHPVVLGLVLLKKYGADWLGWESETLELRVPQDFKVKTISHLNMSKVQAVKTLHLVDSYWQRWEVFVWCTMPFNGVHPDFEVLQPPTVAQCMVSVDTASRIRTDVPWSEEVKTFIATVFQHDGILCPIAPLDFVSVDTDDISLDCEAVRKRLPKALEAKALPETTAENIQLNRLAQAHEYLRTHQALLRAQLPLVDHV